MIEVTTPKRTHTPEMELYAENQRPKTREHHEAKLYRYGNTNLYQWYSKVDTSVSEDPFGEPFEMREI